MVGILINPNCPELVFAAAALAVEFEKTYPDDIIDIMTFYPTDFSQKLSTTYDALLENMYKYGQLYPAENAKHDFTSLMPDEYPHKIALLGIYPSGKEEVDDLIGFFERESDNIITWIDWHEWPAGLVEFFYSQNKNVIIKPNVSPLKLTGIFCPLELVAAEQAMINKWRRNTLARRYWKAYRYMQIVNYRNPFARSILFGLFQFIVEEIITEVENISVTLFAESYGLAIATTREAIKRFSSEHPAFAEAKRHNRPVGFLSVRDLGVVDMEKIIQAGLKKFPWLLSIENGDSEYPFLDLESAKVPIEEILHEYTDVFQDTTNAQKIMEVANKIIIGYKETV